MERFAIYYGDGSVVYDGDPFEAPRTNVQLIAFKNSQLGWELMSQSDYYYYEAESHGWCITDQFGMYDVLTRSKQPLILFGRWLSQEDYKSVIDRVLKDLPEPKTLWRRGTPTWLEGV